MGDRGHSSHLMLLFDLQLLARNQDKSQSQEKTLTMLLMLVINQAMLSMGKTGTCSSSPWPKHFLHGGTSNVTLTRQVLPEWSAYPVQIHSQ